MVQSFLLLSPVSLGQDLEISMSGDVCADPHLPHLYIYIYIYTFVSITIRCHNEAHGQSILLKQQLNSKLEALFSEIFEHNV